MQTSPSRAVRLSPSSGALRRLRAATAARAVALVASLSATACVLGFRGPNEDASVEIRNTADIGVNLYVLHAHGIKDNFLGQVGPKHSLLFWPGKIVVHIGEPLLPAEIQGLDHGALMQRVRGRIVTLSGTPAR